MKIKAFLDKQAKSLGYGQDVATKYSDQVSDQLSQIARDTSNNRLDAPEFQASNDAGEIGDLVVTYTNAAGGNPLSV